MFEVAYCYWFKKTNKANTDPTYLEKKKKQIQIQFRYLQSTKENV
jgi:hypothetical protein